MSGKFNQAARAAKIFLNEDLTQLEQRNRSNLLPLYRALRAKQVSFRLDNRSLVMNSKVFFDLETALKTLLDGCPNSDFRSTLEEVLDILATNQACTGPPLNHSHATTRSRGPLRGVSNEALPELPRINEKIFIY